MFRPLAPYLVLAVCSGGFAAPPSGTKEAPPSFAWFGDKPLAPNVMKGVDYAWLKPGLNLNGHTISVLGWTLPQFHTANGKVQARVTYFSNRFPSLLQYALVSAGKGRLKVATEGDLQLQGQVVDFKPASAASQFLGGFGKFSETLTWNLALVDRRTREVVAGFQHQLVNHTDSAWALDSQTQAWADAWAPALVAAAWNDQPDTVAQEAPAPAAAPPAPEPAAPAPVATPAPVAAPAPPPAPMQAPVPEPPAPIQAPAEPAKAAPPAQSPAPAGKSDIQGLADDLERLDRLRQQGIIKEEEYQVLKERAIANATRKP